MPFCEGGIQGARVPNQSLQDVIKDRYGKIARGEVYEAPGMDERLRGKILSVEVRALKTK